MSLHFLHVLQPCPVRPTLPPEISQFSTTKTISQYFPQLKKKKKKINNTTFSFFFYKTWPIVMDKVKTYVVRITPNVMDN